MFHSLTGVFLLSPLSGKPLNVDHGGKDWSKLEAGPS